MKKLPLIAIATYGAMVAEAFACSSVWQRQFGLNSSALVQMVC